MGRLEKIYGTLIDTGNLTLDFDTFKNKMQYADYQEKIFKFVEEKGLYSKSLESFKEQYGHKQKLSHVVDLKEEAKDFRYNFIEKDFTIRMSEQYKDAEGNQLVKFIETSPTADRFKMYDVRTGKYSEEIQLPGQPGMFSIPTVVRWDQVNEKIKKFVDNPTTPSEEYVSQKDAATEEIYTKIDDVLEKVNFDAGFDSAEILNNLSNYVTNGKYIQKVERGGGTEADSDYDLVQKLLKKEVGDFGGIFGGTFSPDGKYSQLN